LGGTSPSRFGTEVRTSIKSKNAQQRSENKKRAAVRDYHSLNSDISVCKLRKKEITAGKLKRAGIKFYDELTPIRRTGSATERARTQGTSPRVTVGLMDYAPEV